ARIDVDAHHAAGRKLLHAVEQTQSAGDISPGQVVLERSTVETPRRLGKREDCFQLRRERDARRRAPDEQRLLAGAIANEKKTARFLVVERHGELTGQPLDELFAPFLVGLEDHFGIAGAAERVTFRRQFVADFAIVVDLAVERDMYAPAG